jgi:hypothetical protein
MTHGGVCSFAPLGITIEPPPMSYLHADLAAAFSSYENNPIGNLDCFRLASAVRETARNKFGDEIPSDVGAEWMALSFYPDHGDGPGSWGTYFGPKSVLPGNDGRWRESPSIRNIDGETLNYWLRRADEAAHPILRSRYADLVWDLSKLATDRKPPITALKTAVDEYLRAAETVEDANSSDITRWLRRALALSLSVDDEERIQKAVKAILSFAERIDTDRVWGHAYGVLFQEEKVNATEAQRQAVLTGLRRQADKELGGDSVLPFQGGEATLLLAEHYWEIGRKEAAQDLANRYAAACLPSCEKAMALLACDWLTKLENMLRRYEMKEYAERVAVLLVERSKGIKDNLAHLEYREKIDVRPLDEQIGRMLDRPLEEAIAAFWNEFVPRVEDVREQAKARNQGFLMSFFGATHVDSAGRVARKLPSYQEDPEAYISLAYSEHLEYWSFFLKRAFDKFREKFKPGTEELLQVLELSPLFGEHNRILVRRGLDAYLSNDHVATVHVLVPVVEAALRALLQGLGRPVWRAPRKGSDQERHVVLIDELLRDPALQDYMGENASMYLRMLLSDRRGWNIRNNVSHGLLHGESFGRVLSDRLIHVLFGLGMVRGKEKENGGDDPARSTKR